MDLASQCRWDYLQNHGLVEKIRNVQHIFHLGFCYIVGAYKPQPPLKIDV